MTEVVKAEDDVSEPTPHPGAETDWTCQKCQAAGVVLHEPSEDVYSVRNTIATRHREASPWCHTEWGLGCVTVRNA